jgi:hypothetical protein
VIGPASESAVDNSCVTAVIVIGTTITGAVAGDSAVNDDDDVEVTRPGTNTTPVKTGIHNDGAILDKNCPMA